MRTTSCAPGHAERSIRSCHALRWFLLQLETVLKVQAHMSRDAEEVVPLLFLIAESRRLIAQFGKGMGDRRFDLVFEGIVGHRFKLTHNC
jgi:hypothetical protein